MALDVKYVKERSFLVDWKIIFATFRSDTENNSDHRSAEPAGFADFFTDSLQETKNRGTTRGRPSVFA